LNKFAIVFSYENKAENTVDVTLSTAHEKMAMGLSYSIRQHMPDIDVYCGSFTNHRISEYAKPWFKKYNINLVEELLFTDIGKLDSYMFLRTFTKDYFAKRLLDKYDYIIYLDIDVIMLAPISFTFNPTSPIILTETMPDWITRWHSKHLTDFTGNLYYNWVDIINSHNSYIFNLDFTDPYVLTEHNADKLVSNRIDASSLEKIEQDIGGYHTCFKPPKPYHLFYHYDSFSEAGSLYALKKTHPLEYKKYFGLFEHVLNTPIRNKEGYWEEIKNDTSRR
jgi:hypothetical protein